MWLDSGSRGSVAGDMDQGCLKRLQACAENDELATILHVNYHKNNKNWQLLGRNLDLCDLTRGPVAEWVFKRQIKN